MSSVVSFLEMMGRDAGLRYAARPAVYKALGESGIDQEAQWAILRADQARLADLLEAHTNLNCLNKTPFEDEGGAEQGCLIANAA